MPSLQLRKASNSSTCSPRVKLTSADDEEDGNFHEIDPFGNADQSWSEEAAEFKSAVSSLALSKASAELPEDLAFGFFSTLRLVNQKIHSADEKMLRFRKLSELSLTGNLISKVNVEYFPRTLSILHLDANLLTTCPDFHEFENLVHLGLAFNQLSSMSSDGCTPWRLPPNLISLDLAGNHLVNLDETLNCLRAARKLKILALSQNPFYFRSDYRDLIIAQLDQLLVLDDRSVSNSERLNLSSTQQPSSSDVFLLIHLKEMTGLSEPVLDQDPERPPDEVTFTVEGKFSELISPNTFKLSTFSWSSDLIEVDAQNCVKWNISREMRDAFGGRFRMSLIKETYRFIKPDDTAGNATTGVAGSHGLGENASSRPASGKSARLKSANSSGKGGAAPPPPKKQPPPPEKGKKGSKPGKKGIEDESQYVKTLFSVAPIAHSELNLAPLIQGNFEFTEDCHFMADVTEPIHEVTVACTMRATVTLNPKVEGLEHLVFHEVTMKPASR
ncbi:hypothetical protein DFJ73DRAFT_832466 [Zopfochytrium polystomum]|nr:hypothetical protein DFJ73DRAFT_832466 [Zopfochytrium polystomum]